MVTANARRSGDASAAGFTLVELLVVVLVIGILSSIALISVAGAARTSERKACVTEWQAVTLAVTAYSNDYDTLDVASGRTGSTNALDLLIKRGYLADADYNNDQAGSSDRHYGVYLFPGPEVRIGRGWNTAETATSQTLAAARCSAAIQ